MSTKTDLAKEIIEKISPCYSKKRSFLYKKTEIFEIEIETEEDSALIQRPKGLYATVETSSIKSPTGEFWEEAEAVAFELSKMLPEKGDILAVGMGNSFLTADSLGPKTAEELFCGEFCGRRLFAFSPGVAGRTGIDPAELVFAITKKLRPAGVVLADALACENIEHICKTVQITNSGIAPGSGLGGAKTAFCEQNLGVPAVALGTPTVLRFGGEKGAFVSPNDTDLLVKRAAKLLAGAIELAVFPKLGTEMIRDLMI